MRSMFTFWRSLVLLALVRKHFTVAQRDAFVVETMAFCDMAVNETLTVTAHSNTMTGQASLFLQDEEDGHRVLCSPFTPLSTNFLSAANVSSRAACEPCQHGVTKFFRVVVERPAGSRVLTSPCRTIRCLPTVRPTVESISTTRLSYFIASHVVTVNGQWPDNNFQPSALYMVPSSANDYTSLQDITLRRFERFVNGSFEMTFEVPGFQPLGRYTLLVELPVDVEPNIWALIRHTSRFALEFVLPDVSIFPSILDVRSSSVCSLSTQFSTESVSTYFKASNVDIRFIHESGHHEIHPLLLTVNATGATVTVTTAISVINCIAGRYFLSVDDQRFAASVTCLAPHVQPAMPTVLDFNDHRLISFYIKPDPNFDSASYTTRLCARYQNRNCTYCERSKVETVLYNKDPLLRVECTVLDEKPPLRWIQIAFQFNSSFDQNYWVSNVSHYSKGPYPLDITSQSVQSGWFPNQFIYQLWNTPDSTRFTAESSITIPSEFRSFSQFELADFPSAGRVATDNLADWKVTNQIVGNMIALIDQMIRAFEPLHDTLPWQIKRLEALRTLQNRYIRYSVSMQQTPRAVVRLPKSWHAASLATMQSTLDHMSIHLKIPPSLFNGTWFSSIPELSYGSIMLALSSDIEHYPITDHSGAKERPYDDRFWFGVGSDISLVDPRNGQFIVPAFLVTVSENKERQLIVQSLKQRIADHFGSETAETIPFLTLEEVQMEVLLLHLSRVFSADRAVMFAQSILNPNDVAASSLKSFTVQDFQPGLLLVQTSRDASLLGVGFAELFESVHDLNRFEMQLFNPANLKMIRRDLDIEPGSSVCSNYLATNVSMSDSTDDLPFCYRRLVDYFSSVQMSVQPGEYLIQSISNGRYKPL
eukprot:GILJ01008059.1.p1 GENE.GILJ01008059.1~~GILJ01008059.1.p1  ORF type:complete len:875 (+),score=116.20 GILJ01008059.1:88-2712(+)